MHGLFNASQWGRHCGSLTLGTYGWGMKNLPTPEEEATLLGKELELLEAPVVAASLQEHLETPEPIKSTEQINTLSTPAPSSPTPKPFHHFSWKIKKSQWGIEANPSLTSKWIQSFIGKKERVPDWWREFQSILYSKDEPCTNIQVKELAHQQTAVFRLPSTKLEKSGWCSTLPCLGVLRRKDDLPPKEFQGVQEYQVMWREEMVALAMAFQRCAVWSGMPQVCYAEQYRSSTGASCSCQGGWSVRPQNAGYGKEGLHGSSWPYKRGLVIRTQSERASQPTCPWWTTHFGARGGCSLRRIGPCMEEKTTVPPGFTLLWVH